MSRISTYLASGRDDCTRARRAPSSVTASMHSGSSSTSNGRSTRSLSNRANGQDLPPPDFFRNSASQDNWQRRVEPDWEECEVVPRGVVTKRLHTSRDAAQSQSRHRRDRYSELAPSDSVSQVSSKGDSRYCSGRGYKGSQRRDSVVEDDRFDGQDYDYPAYRDGASQAVSSRGSSESSNARRGRESRRRGSVVEEGTSCIVEEEYPAEAEWRAVSGFGRYDRPYKDNTSGHWLVELRRKAR